jgi:hypothetical protein
MQLCTLHSALPKRDAEQFADKGGHRSRRGADREHARRVLETSAAASNPPPKRDERRYDRARGQAGSTRLFFTSDVQTSTILVRRRNDDAKTPR